MAKNQLNIRGRWTVALILLGFVLVAASVIWRRSLGLRQAREIAALESERGDLESRRAQLESEIEAASGSERISRIAEERLGMRLAGDSDFVVLRRPNNK